MAAVPAWTIRVAVIGGLILSISLIQWIDRHRKWGVRRRSRLLLGIPWGTLVTLTGVLCVYLFLQDGWMHWHRPLTVPYRSWSYLYPLGMGVSAFAHHGPSHLLGNLIGALVVGSLAEYAWGHFPEARGTSTFSSVRTNPYARAFVIFPLSVIIIGVVTSLLSWGPTIGFSGVLFAFAGFALVRYPIITVVALEVDDVVRIIYRALENPVLVAQAEPRFIEPWWAGIAVQGHLLGLFLGIIVGAVVLRGREASVARLWAGMLIVGTSLSLWAIWWFRGSDQFVLYRGIGVVLVFGLALLVAVGFRFRSENRPVFAVPMRQIALLLLIFPVLVIGIVAVPLNLNTVHDTALSGETVTVRDYTIGYAEGVTNQQVSVVNLSVFGETTNVRTSGVIVVSPDRHAWTRQVSNRRLAFVGDTSVRVGGVGWAETVNVARRGWEVTGNGTAYRVWLRAPGEDWRLVYLSDPVVAEPVLNGLRIAFRPEAEGVRLDVRPNGTTVNQSEVTTVPLPTVNESSTARGITFVREDQSVYATFDNTRVRIATRERYRGRN